MSGTLVLVTGGSGFVGAECIIQLLAAGYHVRATLRSLTREAEVREMLKVAGTKLDELSEGALSFVVADLTADAGWAEAVAGCEFVLHVASPFPAGPPRHRDDLIIPARDGTLRVLKAARDAGVKRVVLTSSFAAIGYGRQNYEQPLTEENWTVLDSGVNPYAASKSLAERAAWDFIKTDGGGLELAVVNPVGIYGPALGPNLSTSLKIVQTLLDGKMPGLPMISFGVVDNRDVVDLHLRAMTHPAAKGERFLAVAGDFITFPQFAQILREGVGDAGKLVTSRVLPSWLVWLLSWFMRSVAMYVLPELNKPKRVSSDKAQRMLGWRPKSREDAIIASAQSLIRLGLVKQI